MGYLTKREWRYAKIFFGVFKGGAQEVKVILGKCKGGGVEMIYIYFHRLWKVNDIYTFFFKGTFTLQIYFILFYKSSKGKYFFFGYQGIIGYPTLFVSLVCLSLLNFFLKRFFPLISVLPSFSLVFIFFFPFFFLFYIILFLFLLDFFFGPYFPILPLLCLYIYIYIYISFIFF